ncbi:MAG TPA: TRAP transporter small permease subunit [Noviherbaspirillum sp.]
MSDNQRRTAWQDNRIPLPARLIRCYVSEQVPAVVRRSLRIDVVLIAGHAFSRKFFAVAHNFVIDLQWHFFAAVVLGMTGTTLKRNEDARFDVFSDRLGERGMAWIDLAGFALFLLPLCLAMVWFPWLIFVAAFLAGEFFRQGSRGVARRLRKPDTSSSMVSRCLASILTSP